MVGVYLFLCGDRVTDSGERTSGSAANAPALPANPWRVWFTFHDPRPNASFRSDNRVDVQLIEQGPWVSGAGSTRTSAARRLITLIIAIRLAPAAEPAPAPLA
jgi:hypothetical protein